MRLRQAGDARAHKLPDRVGQVEFQSLGQVSQVGASRQKNRAAVCFLFMGQDAQQGRFAAAVGTDQPHPVAGLDRKGNILQDRLNPVGFCNLMRLQHASCPILLALKQKAAGPSGTRDLHIGIEKQQAHVRQRGRTPLIFQQPGAPVLFRLNLCHRFLLDLVLRISQPTACVKKMIKTVTFIL